MAKIVICFYRPVDLIGCPLVDLIAHLDPPTWKFNSIKLVDHMWSILIGKFLPFKKKRRNHPHPIFLLSPCEM